MRCKTCPHGLQSPMVCKPLALSNPGPHDMEYNTSKFAGYFCAHAHAWLYTDKLGPRQNGPR